MKHDKRYIEDEQTFLKYSRVALERCFISQSEFDRFTRHFRTLIQRVVFFASPRSICFWYRKAIGLTRKITKMQSSTT